MGAPIADDVIAAAEARRAEQETEYSQFVAAQDIHHDGGLAYTTGSPVPTSNVKLHGYLQNGLVETAQQAAAKRDAEVKAADDARAAEEAARDAAFEKALAAQGKPPIDPPADQPEPAPQPEGLSPDDTTPKKG